MSDPVKAPIVPTITGNPQLDTFIRYTAAHVGMIVAATSVAWMDAHGFDTKALTANGLDMSFLISTTVGGILMSTLAYVWGAISTRQSQTAITMNTALAAMTGNVPEAIAAKLPADAAQAVENSARANITTDKPATVK